MAPSLTRIAAAAEDYVEAMLLSTCMVACLINPKGSKGSNQQVRNPVATAT